MTSLSSLSACTEESVARQKSVTPVRQKRSRSTNSITFRSAPNPPRKPLLKTWSGR